MQCIRSVGRNTRIRKRERVRVEKLRNHFRLRERGSRSFGNCCMYKHSVWRRGVRGYKDIRIYQFTQSLWSGVSCSLSGAYILLGEEKWYTWICWAVNGWAQRRYTSSWIFLLSFCWISLFMYILKWDQHERLYHHFLCILLRQKIHWRAIIT